MMRFDDDLLPYVLDYFSCGAAREDREAIMTAEIVKEAEFDNMEDEFRVVRLSSSYGQWSHTEMLAVLVPPTGYSCNLQRVTSTGKVKQWAMSPREMDALCEAWLQFKRDYAAHIAGVGGVYHEL